MKLLLPSSRDPSSLAPHLNPAAVSLTALLGEPVEVEIAPDYAELERRLLGSEVALVWAPPALCARAEPTARAILSARRTRSVYRAALVARASDGLTPLSLAGRRAVWTDPLSTGGYLLPTAFLRLIHQVPEEIFSSERFLGTYRACLEAVLAGEADVTAIYTPRPLASAVEQQMRELVGDRAAALSPLAFTEEVPADGLVITDALSPALAERLAGALSGADGPERVPGALLALLAAEGFTRARPGDYRYLRSQPRPRAPRG